MWHQSTVPLANRSLEVNRSRLPPPSVSAKPTRPTAGRAARSASRLVATSSIPEAPTRANPSRERCPSGACGSADCLTGGASGTLHRVGQRGLPRAAPLKGHNGSVARSEGRSMGSTRGGARRGAKPKRSVRAHVVGLGVGAFVALVAWGALVWSAIPFGRSARGGDSGKWVYLAAASIGAVVCLFLSLWLLTMLLRRVGILEDDHEPAHPHRDSHQPAPHRH